PRAHLVGALMRFHDVQIVIDPDAEHPDEGIEQIGVLRRGHVDGLDRTSPSLELLDDRGKLDDLGSGAEEGQNLLVTLAARPERREVTVPLQVPSRVTVRLTRRTARRAKTVVLAVRVTVQGPVPAQPPPVQPSKVEPLAGVAVRVTAVPLS